MIDFLARLANRRAWLVLVSAVFAIGLAAIVGLPVAGAMSGGNPDFVTPGSASVRADQLIEQASGIHADGGIFALVTSGAPIDSPRTRHQVTLVAKAMAAEPAFARVQTYYQAHNPDLLSADGRQTLVVGLLKSDEKAHYQDAVNHLNAKLGHDPDVLLGGSEVVGNQVVSIVEHDLLRAELLAFPVLFILSLLIFRGLLASALPLLIGGSNVALALLGMRVVNSFTGLSIFTLNLVTALGLGLAIDYSLLVVSRFRGELAGGADVPTAITVTLRTAGRTVLFSSLTVSAAMTSLFAFQQRILYSFAVGGLLVAVSSALVALVVLPAMLRLLGRQIDFLSPRRWRRALEQPESATGGWFTLARGVMRRAPWVAVAAVAVLVAIGLPFARVAFDTVGPQELPAGQSSRVVDTALLSHFPSDPLDAIQVVVTAPAGRSGQAPVRQAPALLADAGSLRTRIAALPGVASVSPVQQLSAGTALIQVSPSQPGVSASSQQLVRSIRALHIQDQMVVGGQTAGFLDLKSGILARLPIAALIVFLVSGLLLSLMTGSLLLPLAAIVMNLLTMSATFGVLVVIFQQGHLSGLLGTSSQGALDATQPILLFALVFGLSTDYGVFLLARIKEARDAGAGEREAVVLGLGRTGRIVTAAAILFCVAMGALATSRIVFIKELGFGTALGVLLDATVVRILLVPSLMRMLGRWSWWAPPPLRYLYRRFGLSESASSESTLSESTLNESTLSDSAQPGPLAGLVPADSLREESSRSGSRRAGLLSRSASKGETCITSSSGVICAIPSPKSTAGNTPRSSASSRPAPSTGFPDRTR
jgi:RND superfamily putative drug exporter